MLKKTVLGAVVLLFVLSIGIFFWARAVFTQETVRTALASQLSTALGQPVKVGGISAGIYPRVTVNLADVTIGEPARIHVQTLHVGTDFWALVSRRIEHARLELSNARVDLPLPAFSIGGRGSSAAPSSKPPVEIVSIDAIVLRGVAIVSGGRTLSGDIEVVPEGAGAVLKQITLRADNATVNVTGKLTQLSPATGDIAIKAGTLNFDQLTAFVNDFSTGAGTAATAGQATTRTPAARTAAPSMNISATLDADRATIGALSLAKLAGKARITGDAMTIDPIRFDVFGGQYVGSLALGLGATEDFKLNATLNGVDVAAATAFAGSPGTISGRLSGKLTLAGRGMNAPSVMRTAHGVARVDIVDGTVKNLGLVRSVVVATSGRSGSGGDTGGGSKDEPFTRLGSTLTIANGSATTDDLRFASKDLLLAATGSVRLDGTAINLAGQVQLSDELSKQAGRDLVRYTQEGGRVTLPATITGSAESPHVMIDLASLAKRAVVNRAQEEAGKALKKGLSGLFKK